jgi:hypothetical protein
MRPHKLNVYGHMRFVIDLIITFVIFYLISLTDRENFTSDLGQVFVIVIPILFGLFIIWDYLKSKEYGDTFSENEKQSEINQRWKTAYAFGFSILQLIIFLILSDIWSKSEADVLTLYLLFILCMFGLNTWYRIIKNNITSLRPGWTATTNIEP